MLRFNCRWNEAGIGDMFPEEDERVSSSFDVVMRLLCISMGIRGSYG
jgi:hypothetical protein